MNSFREKLENFLKHVPNFIILVTAIFSSNIFIGCNSTETRLTPVIKDTPVNKPAIADTLYKSVTKGDFNGDGKQEYAYLVAPKIDTSGMDCVGDCICLIKFSDSTIPVVRLKQCIGGQPINLGDLNKNGSDEIGLLPEWFTSCWMAYYVYTFEKGKWIEAVPAFSTHCNQWEDSVKPIEIDPKIPGHVIIHYSESNDTGIVVKSKSISIK